METAFGSRSLADSPVKPKYPDRTDRILWPTPKRKESRMRVILAVAFGLLIAGCQTATQHAADVRGARASGDQLSVGKVQREIRVGMSTAEVVEVLGSPNMLTTDDKRRETWVYDRISTDSVHSSSSGGVGILVLGVIGSAGASSASQRTLTILVKFDESSRVRDFAYRSSSF